MRKCWLCCAALLFYSFASHSQYYFYDGNHLEPEWRWELGISIGYMNCLTDLGGAKGNGKKFIKDVNWKNGRPCTGLYLEVAHHDLVGLRLEFTIGQVKAFDSILKNEATVAALRYKRNLQFKSAVTEFNLLAEFHPLSLNGYTLRTFSPYLLLGLGFFHFDPQAKDQNEWIKLKPLHTEGEGFQECAGTNEYKLNQLSVPVGFGLKYEVSAVLNLKLELNYRILFTDYLDDVSTMYIDPALFNKYFDPAQAELAKRLADRTVELDPTHQTQPNAIRGNPQNNDSYFSFSLKCGFVLNRKHY